MRLSEVFRVEAERLADRLADLELDVAKTQIEVIRGFSASLGELVERLSEETDKTAGSAELGFRGSAIAERVRELLRDRGMRRKELVARLGLSPSQTAELTALDRVLADPASGLLYHKGWYRLAQDKSIPAAIMSAVARLFWSQIGAYADSEDDVESAASGAYVRRRQLMSAIDEVESDPDRAEDLVATLVEEQVLDINRSWVRLGRRWKTLLSHAPEGPKLLAITDAREA